jgi:hypothetical protein
MYQKLLDVELAENVDPDVDAIKKKSFGRRAPLLQQGKDTVRALFEVDQFRVVCCKKDSKLRLIVNKDLKDPVVRALGTRVPDPPGPPTRGNMGKAAKCAFPIPFLFHSKGTDDSTKCLQAAFPKAKFGPLSIKKGTDLDKCVS